MRTGIETSPRAAIQKVDAENKQITYEYRLGSWGQAKAEDIESYLVS